MLAALILAAALQVLSPADGVGEFRVLCLDSVGDPGRVAAAVSHRGGWTAPARAGALQVWSRQDDPTATLVAGRQEGRLVCMLTVDEAPGLDEALTATLGPYFGAIDDSSGLYVFAPSAEAFERRELVFVQVSTAERKTKLTAINPRD